MGIRTYQKDHLKELASPLTEVQFENRQSVSADPLRFETKHASHPVVIDLNPFKNGEHQRSGAGNFWGGPFTGRPALIAQLAPVLFELAEYRPAATVNQYVTYFRVWWRHFDAVERECAAPGMPAPVVTTVADITEIHRQRAFDRGMSSPCFSGFIRMVNMVRRVQQLAPLYWKPPERTEARRHLPPRWEIDKIRIRLKHNWFDTLHRWERTAELLQETAPQPQSQTEVKLLKNYRHFISTAIRLRHPRPSIKMLGKGMDRHTFYAQGYNVSDMLRGFYPDGEDIRTAFHLCLASTGWNPSVLVDLDVTAGFIEPHPKDPTRYLMRGYKARGNSEQVTEGMSKVQGSPGNILRTLMRRTRPLRAHLKRKLATAKVTYASLQGQGVASTALEDARGEIARLERGVRSPWLYVAANTDQVLWLDKISFARGRAKDGSSSFLDDLIFDINEKEKVMAEKQGRLERLRLVSNLNSSDFRDAFAAFAYEMSGGMVLYVMKVLGHKSPKTTQGYLNNTLLNGESNRLYSKFGNALWHEVKMHGRVDPTLIAKWSRDESVTDDERQRLHDYRSLKRSRIGLGCKDPTHPPAHIAPNFQADGKAMCPVQRCTLCVEHAVIYPDSLTGLCKRLAELRHIQSQMPVVAFSESSFGEEMKNTEIVLERFDQQKVSAILEDYSQRIAAGRHCVIEFDGLQGVPA